MILKGIPWKIEKYGYRYVEGPSGIGAWSKLRNSDGSFYSFFLRRAGKGARSGGGTHWQYVPRLTSTRRAKKAARERSYRLAHGEALTQPKSKVSLPDTGWCTKERQTVFVTWQEMTTTESGRTMIHGACQSCGHTVHRFGKLIDCPECGQTREARSNDYICRFCREKID